MSWKSTSVLYRCGLNWPVGTVLCCFHAGCDMRCCSFPTLRILMQMLLQILLHLCFQMFWVESCRSLTTESFQHRLRDEREVNLDTSHAESWSWSWSWSKLNSDWTNTVNQSVPTPSQRPVSTTTSRMKLFHSTCGPTWFWVLTVDCVCLLKNHLNNIVSVSVVQSSAELGWYSTAHEINMWAACYLSLLTDQSLVQNDLFMLLTRRQWIKAELTAVRSSTVGHDGDPARLNVFSHPELGHNKPLTVFVWYRWPVKDLLTYSRK